MKAAKFNPTGQPGAAISYDAERIGNMTRKEFGESGEAKMLFHGQEINEAYRNTILDAWHLDAQTQIGKSAEPAKDAKTK